MINLLNKYNLLDDLSINVPIQVRELRSSKSNISVIDYDYLGYARETDYNSFANQLYDYLHKDIACNQFILVTYSREMKDSQILRRSFKFNLENYSFKEKCITYCCHVNKEYILFIGLIDIVSKIDFIHAVKFMFSGIYDSKSMLLLDKSFNKNDLSKALEYSLHIERSRHGYIKSTEISLKSFSEIKGNITILYPFGGTDFGSFMLFEC